LHLGHGESVVSGTLGGLESGGFDLGEEGVNGLYCGFTLRAKRVRMRDGEERSDKQKVVSCCPVAMARSEATS